jgi:hypothetical protein
MPQQAHRKNYRSANRATAATGRSYSRYRKELQQVQEGATAGTGRSHIRYRKELQQLYNKTLLSSKCIHM